MTTFIYRGPLAPDSTLFRGREPELRTLLNLCQGEVQAYAIVYGGRQTGKTSLLKRLEAQLVPPMWTCCVDWQGLPGANSAQAYRYLAQCVAESLPEPLAAPENVDNAPGLMHFLCRALEQPNLKRLVLLIEEFGALPQSTREDLANVLRSFFTSRHSRTSRPLARLMVVLSGSLELYTLAATQVSTLHNICESVYLPDLNAADAISLVTGELMELGITAGIAHTLGEAVYTHVNGHPYLTQRLGGLLEMHIAAGQTPTTADVEQAVAHLLRDDPLLQHLHTALDECALVDTAQELLRGPVRFSRLDENLARLELLGLVAEREGNWRVRNALLERALWEWTTISDGVKDHSFISLSALRAGFKRLDDVDLNALCLDYFPHVYEKFSGTLRHDEKINLLLEYCYRNPEEARRLEELLKD